MNCTVMYSISPRRKSSPSGATFKGASGLMIRTCRSLRRSANPCPRLTKRATKTFSRNSLPGASRLMEGIGFPLTPRRMTHCTFARAVTRMSIFATSSSTPTTSAMVRRPLSPTKESSSRERRTRNRQTTRSRDKAGFRVSRFQSSRCQTESRNCHAGKLCRLRNLETLKLDSGKLRHFANLRLVEQILPPLIVRPPHQSHDVPAGMQIEGVWLAHQLHAGLERYLISLPPVARMAAGDKVLPGRSATTGAWHHVVERQFTSRQQLAAVLAGIAVTQKNVLARKRSCLVRNTTILEQPNYRRNSQRQARRMQEMPILLFRHGDALQHQHNGAAGRANVDRFIRGV